MNIVPYSVKCKSLSLVCLFAAPWTVAWQALLSMGRILRVGSDSLFQGIFPTQGSALAVFLAGKFFTIWVTSFLCYTVNLCCWSILCISWTVSVQSLSPVWLFATPWIAACQASLSITNSQSSLRLMSIELVMPSAISFSVVPFSSCPQSLPASESLPMSQLFAWGGQSTGVSALASFLPKKSQDWSPLEWTGWVSLQSKGLSRVFSNTTVQKYQFLQCSAFFTVQLSWKGLKQSNA